MNISVAGNCPVAGVHRMHSSSVTGIRCNNSVRRRSWKSQLDIMVQKHDDTMMK